MITTNSTLQEIKQDKIYSSVQHIVNRYMQCLRDITTCDDLMQEADIAISKALKAYNPDRGVSLYNYILKRVEWAMGTYVRLRSHLVRHLNRKCIVDLDNEDVQDTIESTVLSNETKSSVVDVKELMKYVPKSKARLVYDIYVKGVSIEELAKATGKDKAYIKRELTRALKRTKKNFKNLLTRK